MRPILILLMLVGVLAGCGQSSSGGSSGASTGSPSQVSGVYLRHTSGNSGAGAPVGGVTIGIYARPISTGGPIMADRPEPIATTTTHPDGSFAFTVHGRSRVFVAPIHDTAYGQGRWAVVGGAPITLSGCTDCVRPL